MLEGAGVLLEALHSLAREGRLTADRAAAACGMDEATLAGVVSDAYLKFLVTELKPFIDRTYRTRTGPADTFVMGSSMGGLISCYAVAEYPQVFGGAGCVSTHWPIGDGAVIDYLKRTMPDPRTHRFYMDHGTATLDAMYAPYQLRADSVMRSAGYVDGKNYMTRVFVGAEHNERAWRVRMGEALAFLIGR